MIVNPQEYPQHSIPQSARRSAYEVNGALLPSYIYDPKGFITPSTYKLVNSKLSKLRKDTGVEMCIILIDHLKNFENPYEFTKKVFDRFGVGDRVDNNGIVLSLVILDRELEFVHGKGMNNILRYSKYDEIIDGMKYFLRKNDVDAAVNYAVNAVIHQAENPPSFFLQIVYFFQDHILFDFLLIIGLFLLGLFILKRRKSQRVRLRESQYRAEMDGMMQHLQSPNTLSKPVFSPICAICMERFSDEHVQRNEAYATIMEKRRLEEQYPDVPSGIEEEPVNWSIDTGVETFTKCGHQMHRSCVTNWLKRSDTCPICRVRNPRGPKESGERGGKGGGENGSSSCYSSAFTQNQPAPMTSGDIELMLRRDHVNTYYNPYSYFHPWRRRRRSYDSHRYSVSGSSSFSFSSHSSGSHFGGGTSSGGGHRGGSW